MTTALNSSRRMLLLLAAIFFVPIAIAFALYYGGNWRPAGQTNKGELMQPARPLPQMKLQPVGTGDATIDPLRGKWSLVYIGVGDCDADCRQALLVMRQTRLALNSEMDRVERVFLATQPCCDVEFLDTEHRGLIAVQVGTPATEALLAVFPDAARAHSLFVVDPLGNLVLRFDARAPPKGLLEDLKKLLRLSHIG